MPNVGAIDSRSGHNRTRVPPRGRRLLGAEAPASAAELSFPDSALRSGVTRVQCYPTAHRTPLPARGLTISSVPCGEDAGIQLPGLGQQATDVTHGEAQQPRGVRYGETPLEDPDQEMCPLLLSCST